MAEITGQEMEIYYLTIPKGGLDHEKKDFQSPKI